MSTQEGSQHTKGPWFIQDHMLKENGDVMTNIGHQTCPHCQKLTYEQPVNIQILTKAWGIAQLGSYDPQAEHDQHLANARLISAAPDLLEACKAVMEEFNDRYDGAPDGGCKWMGSLMHTLEAAIAKAEKP